MGAIIAQLFQLVVLETPVLLVELAPIAALVLSVVPEPHECVDDDAEGDHAQCDGVAAGVARLVCLGTGRGVSA